MTDSARDAFTYFDVDVSGLSDAQCDQAADLILSRFGGLTPDIKQIVAVVAEVSAEGASGGLSVSSAPAVQDEFAPVSAAFTAPSPGSLTGPPSAHPVSTRCSSCTPRWSVSPSGGGFFHSASCELKPNQKIYRPGTEAKQRERMVASHRAEDARTGMVFTHRVSPCEKCSTPTSRGRYCPDCFALLSLIRGGKSS